MMFPYAIMTVYTLQYLYFSYVQKFFKKYKVEDSNIFIFITYKSKSNGPIASTSVVEN